MLICFDIGNTNIVFGVYDRGVLLNSFRLKTDPNISYDEYGVKIYNVLQINNIKPSEITGAIISSVVPMMDPIIEQVIVKYFKVKPLFVGPGIKSGINIKIDDPRQLGADLLVGAVAAVNKYRAPAIIIDMGTATTITAVNSKNEFIGGIILPGVITATASLIKSTAKLEEARLEKPKHILGKNTVNSIQSGMVYGTSAMLDGLIRKVKAEIGEAIVILTGGIASVFKDFLEEKVIYDENLLLDGLQILYKKNK